jgi:hypothetical protein
MQYESLSYHYRVTAIVRTIAKTLNMNRGTVRLIFRKDLKVCAKMVQKYLSSKQKMRLPRTVIKIA